MWGGVNPESQAQYPILYSNISKNEFEGTTVVSRVLQSMGYPMSYQEGATSQSGVLLPNAYRVMVDSELTRSKLFTIHNSLMNTDVLWVLHEVRVNGPGFFRDLLSGNLTSFRLSSYNNGIKTLDINDPRVRITLEKCYIKAFEMTEEKWKDRPDLLKIIEQDRPLYDQLKEKGLTPINPEQLGGLITPAILQILEKNPQLRPPTKD